MYNRNAMVLNASLCCSRAALQGRELGVVQILRHVCVLIADSPPSHHACLAEGTASREAGVAVEFGEERKEYGGAKRASLVIVICN